MVADVVQAQRLGIVDQQAQDAAAPGQLADAPVGLAVDAARDEALELAAAVV